MDGSSREVGVSKSLHVVVLCSLSLPRIQAFGSSYSVRAFKLESTGPVIADWYFLLKD